jgi:hypothetical protein
MDQSVVGGERKEALLMKKFTRYLQRWWNEVKTRGEVRRLNPENAFLTATRARDSVPRS